MSGFGYTVSRRAIIAGMLASTFSSCSTTAPGARKPNIVFILADDLGAFDLSCYGRPDFETPHIDSLALDGLKFMFAYANSSTCTPTRVGLLSGRYQNRYVIGSGEGGGYPSETIGYEGDWPSLPKTLKRAGYRTALIGKWGLGELPYYSPNSSGYDEFFGLMSGGFDYWTHQNALSPSKHRETLYENQTRVKAEGYATDLFTDRACDFIERNASQPFLLSLHYNAPHWPWQTRTDRGEPRISDFHYEGGSPAIFAEMVRAMDEGIGRVLETLRRRGLTRNTIVIFTSDNGGERFSMMWPLRGQKGDLWEGGTRVPLLVRWPGRIPRSSATDQVAMSMDFLPTLASIAGVETDPSAPPDGIDLSRQWLGAASTDRTVFWKTPDDSSAALSYPWKYLRLGTREHLFNLEEDLTERANLKNREPEVFARLKSETENWSAQMLPTLPPGMSEEMVRNLEALQPRRR